MLPTIAIALIVLWAFGLLWGYAMGGMIHLLLVVAVIALAMRFFTSRRLV